MPVLIVIDQPPYGRWDGRESLDMAFALAAFDKPVSLLFRGSGVFWLLSNQAGAAIDQKTVSSNLGAAPVFGVENLYADARVVDERDHWIALQHRGSRIVGAANERRQ